MTAGAHEHARDLLDLGWGVVILAKRSDGQDGVFVFAFDWSPLERELTSPDATERAAALALITRGVDTVLADG